MAVERMDGRGSRELRPVQMEVGPAPFAEGSCLIAAGRTRVLCTATVEEGVPPFREGVGGWVTAEYAMLPRSTQERTSRERTGPRGRTHEIQRLIGRSLRAATDLEALGERTITVDCDVLVADGGTRTASITGGCVALYRACSGLLGAGLVQTQPVRPLVAAVSVGMVGGEALLDLDYGEDVRADVDMNVVALAGGEIVEVQGTAEGRAFSRQQLDRMLDLALEGIAELARRQEARLSSG